MANSALFLEVPISNLDCVLAHHISGVQICYQAFRLVHGIGRAKFRHAQELFQKGAHVALHGNLGTRRDTDKFFCSYVWFSLLLEEFGEKHPTGGRVLPAILSWEVLHEAMVKKLSAERKSGLEYSAFRKMITDHFPDVGINKYCRLGKCTTCCSLIGKHLSAETRKQGLEYQQKRSSHLELVRMEKAAYYARAALGQNYPDEHVSLIIDFSDTLHLPLFNPFPKAWMKLQKRFPIHIGGIIDHGRQNVLFHHPGEQFGKGPNIIISMLHHHIYHNYLQVAPFRPRRLHLQADNCAGENKNCYVLSYLCLLVHLNIFSEVNFNFLPVGHTHEDIDRLFSRLHDLRTTHNCFHPADVREAISHIYQASEFHPSYVSLPFIYNWKDYLRPFMNEIEGIKQPRSFRIFRLQDKVVLTARHSCRDIEESKPVILLTACPPGLPSPCAFKPFQEKVMHV